MSSFDLTAKVSQGLESGDLRAFDVERMLDRSRRRGRFRLPSLFAAVGLLTMVSGLAFLYIAGYHSLTLTERRFTPFAFPAMLMGAAILLDRLRRPRWQVELAAMVADVATALAFIGASGAWGGGQSYGADAGAISLVLSIVIYLRLRLARLTAWAASVSLIALTTFGTSPHSPSDLAGTFLVEAAAAAIVGFALIKTRPAVATQALYVATLTGFLAGLVGTLGDALFVPDPGVSIWAAELLITTLAAFAVAAVLELNGLLWLGSMGSLLCLATALEPGHGRRHWALVTIAVGLGITVLAGLAGHLHTPPRTLTERADSS